MKLRLNGDQELPNGRIVPVVREELSGVLERLRRRCVWWLTWMLFHEDQVTSVETTLLEAEVRQHADQVVVSLSIGMDEDMLTCVLRGVSECRLEEQFADLPSAY